jgi:hypothetical protein
MNPSDQPAAEPQVFTEPSRAEVRTQARDLVHRFLGNTTGDAQDMVADLVDEEVDGIIAAGSDRHTAVQGIKSVFTAAYERKRKAHEAEVQADLAKAQAARADREAAAFDRVEATGEGPSSTITVSIADGTLEPDFSPE